MSGIPSLLRAALSALLIAALQLPLLFAGYAAAEVQGEGLTVWVPPTMIAGQRYAGVVMTTEVSDVAREVLLVAGNPAVAVPERVVLEPGRHQAAFEIDVGPYSSPSATVSAVMAGALAQVASKLYDGQAASGMVRLYAFNSTSLSFARVVVTVGQPEKASGPAGLSGDSVVTLVYPAGTIEVQVDGAKGYGQADVPLVDGANRISVFGRPGEEITVTRTPVDAAVKVGAASLSTVPAWTPEWGYQKSWILVDAEQKGKPIRGEFEVIATSSNPQVVEVEKARTYCRLPCAIPVMGRAEGAAQVGIQVAGLGSSSVSISAVSPMRHTPSQAEAEERARKYIILPGAGGAGQLVIINDTSLSGHFSEKVVSSSVTDGPVYGLVGHFATLVANYTVVTTSGNTTMEVLGKFSKAVPLVIPGVKYHASLGGPATIQAGFFAGLMGGDMRPASGALTGGHPSVVVGSAPAGIGSSHSAMSSFDVSLSEPVGHAELKGELAAIAIPEAGVQLAAYLAGGTVRGYHLHERGVLPANTSAPAPADIVVVLPGAPSSPELRVVVPALVYPAEGLIFAAHLVQGGIPVQKVEPLYELGRASPEGAGNVQEIGGVFIHPASGQAARITLSAVMNVIDLDIAWPEVLRLDRPQDVPVTASVPGAWIQISGDVRGAPGDSKVTLYPAGAEGDRRVVITASKAGWAGATAEKVLPAMRLVNVTVDAVDRKGNPVYAPFVLQYETVDGEQGRVEDMTPFAFEVRPLASGHVLTFDVAPAEANGGKRYVYQSIREVEADGSGYTGVYEGQVRLTVVNGAGEGGYYLPGQMVRIEAGPDRQVVGFAVVERFSHWEYDSQSLYVHDRNARVQEAIIIGEADSVVTAVYATNFASLAVLVILTVAGVGAYAYREEIRTVLEAYRRRA